MMTPVTITYLTWGVFAAECPCQWIHEGSVADTYQAALQHSRTCTVAPNE